MSLFFLQSMTLKEACKSALTILKQVMEEKLNSSNVEVIILTLISDREVLNHLILSFAMTINYYHLDWVSLTPIELRLGVHYPYWA